MADSIYDNHTLYVPCRGMVAREQLTEFVRTAIALCAKFLEREITCGFLINIVADRSGQQLGLAYIYLDNSLVYHLLVGNNPDGSPRQEAIEATTLDGAEPSSTNWSDLADEVSYVALPPLVSFPLTLAPLSPEQEQVNLTIQRAYIVNSPEHNYNTLVAREVPPWITATMINKRFALFTQREGTTTYPQVTINNRRACIVRFSPHTYAAFPLFMMKKLTFTRKEGDHTLIFRPLRAS